MISLKITLVVFLDFDISILIFSYLLIGQRSVSLPPVHPLIAVPQEHLKEFTFFKILVQTSTETQG